MSIAKIQNGDNVKVIAGKFKGTKGVVTKVIKINNITRVAVDTISKITKYTKSNKSYGIQGQMTNVDRFIDRSNVSLVDNNDKATKSFVSLENGKKIRKYRTTLAVVSKQKKSNDSQKNEVNIKE